MRGSQKADGIAAARLRSVLPAVPFPSQAAVPAVIQAAVPSLIQESVGDMITDSPQSTGSVPDPDAGPPEPGGLSAAGAFSDRGVGRRAGWTAWDPGRRGVRALAAFAALVVVVAAVLAWRARPRVDPVASASVGAAETWPGGDGIGGGSSTGSSASSAEVVVAVAGRVRKPGLVRLPPGARVNDALIAAGGVDRGVDAAMLNLARKVVDGELILVGVTGSPGVPGATASRGGPGGSMTGGRLNLNTATLAELDSLPGVGPVLAQRIVDARDAQGGFRAVSDLRKVSGIGDARYEQLKDLVAV